MRLWTFHPKYLDTRGLTALWREALLARNVLLGKTRGYTYHPQLIRFRNSEQSIECIDYYLQIVYEEADRRGYHFNRDKMGDHSKWSPIKTTEGQLLYEWKHFLSKIKKRDKNRFQQIKHIRVLDPHSLFRIVPGPVETWEKVK